MGGVGVAGAYEATKRRNTDDFFPEITLKGEFLQKYRTKKFFCIRSICMYLQAIRAIKDSTILPMYTCIQYMF